METYDSPIDTAPGTEIINTNVANTRIFEKVEIKKCVQKQIILPLVGGEAFGMSRPSYDKSIYTSLENTYKPVQDFQNQAACYSANILWTEIINIIAPALMASDKSNLNARVAEAIKESAVHSNGNILLPLRIAGPGFLSVSVESQVGGAMLTPFVEPIRLPDSLFLHGQETGEFISSDPVIDMIRKWNATERKESKRSIKERYYYIVVELGNETWNDTQSTFEIERNPNAFGSKRHSHYHPHKLYVSKEGLNYLIKKLSLVEPKGKLTPADRVELTIGSHLASIHALANMTLEGAKVVIGSQHAKGNKDLCLFFVDLGNASTIVPSGLRYKEDIMSGGQDLKTNDLYPVRGDVVSEKVRRSLENNKLVFNTKREMFVLGYNNALKLLKIIMDEIRGDGKTKHSFLDDHVTPPYIEALSIPTSMDAKRKVELPNPVKLYAPMPPQSKRLVPMFS